MEISHKCTIFREPCEVKVSRTGLTGGMGKRTARQRALCLPSVRRGERWAEIHCREAAWTPSFDSMS